MHATVGFRRVGYRLPHGRVEDALQRLSSTAGLPRSTFPWSGQDPGLGACYGVGDPPTQFTFKRLRQSDSARDAEAALLELTVNVHDLANDVRVETIQPTNTGGRNYIVDYTITLPKFLQINVNNLNGIVTLNSIDNDVEVNNLNGNITSRKILGSASIDLSNGNIGGEITLPLNGAIDMKTINGDINLSIRMALT
jgi:hypothetical protein